MTQVLLEVMLLKTTKIHFLHSVLSVVAKHKVKRRQDFSIPNDSAAKGCRLYKYTGRTVKELKKKAHNSSFAAAGVVVHCGRLNRADQNDVLLEQQIGYLTE